MPGDALVADANVVMDRVFTLRAPRAEVWPWFVQLGKNRAGWYLPRRVERFIALRRRALRHLDARLLQLAVGDRIDDWGGKRAYFEVAIIEAPHTIAFTSRRGSINLSWTIALTEATEATEVRLRLRLAGVKRPWLARVGELVDRLTVAGLQAGLAERLGA